MLTGLIARLGLNLLFGRIGTVLKLVPPWAWKLLAGALALAFVWHLHTSAVATARADGESAGKAKADAGWRFAFDKQREASRLWRGLYETSAAETANQIGNRHAQDLRDIAAVADDLRLRGPGRAAAACGRPASPARLSPAPGRSDAPGGAEADRLADLPDEGRPFAIVPWPELIASAEQADANRSEVLAWREWYASEKALWDKSRADLVAKLPVPEFGKDAAP